VIEGGLTANCFTFPPSLRAQRSNPEARDVLWIASSLRSSQ